jgi:lipid II:glycine glycyltransferase (peptidoglycan interpeptide bridge formation enzyme)
VDVRIADHADDLVDTYYRLHVETRRRQGVPVQPRKYFRLLWDHMILPGHGLVLLAICGGRAVAGAVYLYGGATVTYKYGASDPQFWPLRPNHAVMATAITWATDKGFSWFDFGRTDLDNTGLRRFKSSWGAVERPLRYTYFSRQRAYGTTRRASRVLSPVIRHGPVFVCRGLGEMFYRYAG